MDRATALAALVRMEGPVADASARLQSFPWDSDAALVTVTPGDFARALRRYSLGEISAAEVESWANALESRDDLRVAPGLLSDLLHELANPLLTEPLSKSRANHWLTKLAHAN
jgi:hypothetical protein